MIDGRSRLRLFTVFHLNLAYSSIEEAEHREVIDACYWPLLRLAEERSLPLGIEAPAWTLERIEAIDAGWVATLRRLVASRTCEFVGSGYVQLIGPLVPAAVNRANLKLGQDAYARILGVRPSVALVNEQAYGAGLVPLYREAGFDALVMEWENAARFHPEWSPAWRHLPQVAAGPDGSRINLLWNGSIAFQRFQRYVHAEIELPQYVRYLEDQRAIGARVLALYGNDVEVFDFRPGRYHTEAPRAADGEWGRIARLFDALAADERFALVRPSVALEALAEPGAGRALRLESAEQPAVVKKQPKYNLTRWAVTGRGDLDINTRCWRLYQALQAVAPGVSRTLSPPAVASGFPSTRLGAGSRTFDDSWKELCWLWSSDFRTHITPARWAAYLDRLADAERRAGGTGLQARSSMPRLKPGTTNGLGSQALQGRDAISPDASGRLAVGTPSVQATLNVRRGLAIDRLFFPPVAGEPLAGTLEHGYFDDISWAADYYTGHLVFEAMGQPKVTDLYPTDAHVSHENGDAIVRGVIATPLGPVMKTIRLSGSEPWMEVAFAVAWETIPPGSLRLGHVTLQPRGFEREHLWYGAHNGGEALERFPLRGRDVDHGEPVSFLVSASHAVGMTEGVLEIGDHRRALVIEVDKASAAVVAMLRYREIGESYFCRVSFSAGELDETVRGARALGAPLICRFRIAARRL